MAGRDLPGIPKRHVPPRPSPPPTIESAQSARDGFRIVAEDAEKRAQQAESEADQLRAALARERRKSAPRVESEAPPATSRPPSRADWSKLIFQLLTLVSLGGAGYAAAKPPPPPPATKEVEVYAALRDEVIRLNEAQRTQAADLAELRAWLKGYFDATGVKVVDPPGAPPPKPVELAPAPLPRPHRLGRAPDVQVRTPLPAPRPVPEPVKLPASIEALPKAP